MNDKIEEKIELLLAKAKEAPESSLSDMETLRNIDATIPNSLADNIKTPEQAKAFRALLGLL